MKTQKPPDPAPADILPRLAEIVRDIGVREIARRAEMQPANVFRLLAGTHTPSLETVTRVLAACGYRLDVVPVEKWPHAEPHTLPRAPHLPNLRDEITKPQLRVDVRGQGRVESRELVYADLAAKQLLRRVIRMQLEPYDECDFNGAIVRFVGVKQCPAHGARVLIAYRNNVNAWGPVHECGPDVLDRLRKRTSKS